MDCGVKKNNQNSGRLHIYTGEGKGKTTAALGLALRAVGSGLQVLFLQFFKPEADPSGEKDFFREHSKNIEFLRSTSRHPFFTGKKTDKEKVRVSVKQLFDQAKEKIFSKEKKIDLIVFDEILGAFGDNFLELDEVEKFLDERPKGLEVVLTGRDAPVELVRSADYVTEMLKIKHPFDSGVKARRGIEY
ncbi:MAG: cob(I)yrinic acid a,c-diamide adenosyltransferase [Deltaproteobacteria bacterium]|nr:cob(I)yrinic acid a,c-diamide adenosyltransferase [Deltaproteobacteria bacterium]